MLWVPSALDILLVSNFDFPIHFQNLLCIHNECQIALILPSISVHLILQEIYLRMRLRTENSELKVQYIVISQVVEAQLVELSFQFMEEQIARVFGC